MPTSGTPYLKNVLIQIVFITFGSSRRCLLETKTAEPTDATTRHPLNMKLPLAHRRVCSLVCFGNQSSERSQFGSQSCTTVSPFTCWSMLMTITVTPSITPKWGRLQDWAWHFHLTWRRHQRHICCVIDPAHLPFSVWLKKSSVRTDYCTA